MRMLTERMEKGDKILLYSLLTRTDYAMSYTAQSFFEIRLILGNCCNTDSDEL